MQDALLVPGDLEAPVAPSARKVTARDRERALCHLTTLLAYVRIILFLTSRKRPLQRSDLSAGRDPRF